MAEKKPKIAPGYRVGRSQMTEATGRDCGCKKSLPPDLTGQVFGKLMVLGQGEEKNGMRYWRCRCACGAENTVRQTNLTSGHTKSCGCLQKEAYKTNLRLIDGTSVTLLEANRRRRISTNTSGHTGVYPHGKSGKWIAQITFKGKTYYLGIFDELEDAVKARKRGEKMYADFLSWYYSEYPSPPREK